MHATASGRDSGDSGQMLLEPHVAEHRTQDQMAKSAEQTVEEADAASSTGGVLASGLILGEGIISIVNLLMASGRVPHL